MGALIFVLNGLKLLVFADVVLSWIMHDKSQFPRDIVTQITDPLYAPIRAFMKPDKTGGLDFSPFIILMLLYLLEAALTQGGAG